MKEWVKSLASTSFGKGLYSQEYQDELLSMIFSHVGTVNPTPFCVEFGFNSNSLTVGTGANVAKLILKEKWHGLLLDGENENPAINLHKHFLTSANICDIFKTYGVPPEPEYVSIDVDSTDLWLFQALLKKYRAMVFSVEYNSNYPLHKAITFPDGTAEHWQGDRGYGASLKALTMVAAEHGYSLLWVVPILDAFFIRNDLIDDGTRQLTFPFSKWAGCTNQQNHAPLKSASRANIFIDYEIYVKSGGNIELSRQAAYKTVMTYLAGNGDLLTKLSKARRVPGRIWRRLRATT